MSKDSWFCGRFQRRENRGKHRRQLYGNSQQILSVFSVVLVVIRSENSNLLLTDYAEVGAEPIVTGSEGSAGDVVLEVVAPEEEGDQPTGFWMADVRLGGIVASESPDAVELVILDAMAKELVLEVGDLLDQGDFVGHGHLPPPTPGRDAWHELHEDPLESDLVIPRVFKGNDIGHGNVGVAADPAQRGCLASRLVSRIDGQRHAEQRFATRAVDRIELVECPLCMKGDAAVFK